MLMITRRIGESLTIGDDVTFTVLDIKGNQIRIGVKAPSNIEVHGAEIYYKIQIEKARNSPVGDETHNRGLS